MNPEDTRCNAVNWEFGMLVTPEHLLRQEQFLEASRLWTLRYTADQFGLIGGGPRLSEIEFGALRNDPVITIAEDELSLRVTVTQCRGITVAGTPIEVSPQAPLYAEFAKDTLGGIWDMRVYIAASPHAYSTVDGAPDENNPDMQTERIRSCQITLHPHADEAEHAIAICRLRRSGDAVAYERDSSFIPPCTNLTAYSELTGAWRRIVEQLSLLSTRFIELHRAMQEYIEMARERGIDGSMDADTLEFVKSIVPAIENCLFDCLNPVQAPAQFFATLRKFLQGAAVSLSLNPPVQQYFDALKSAGETEYVPLMEQQKLLLKSHRRWRVEDDLGLEVRTVIKALKGLRTLESALEGKYIDFRVSPSLETMNFVFDRGGSALYKLAAKPARLQGFGDEMTFYFAGIRLEGREKYRLVLTSELDHEFLEHTNLPVEIRINEGSGSRREPIRGIAQVRFPAQRNVEFDFDAPDVATVTDLRVAVPAHSNARTALLFVRHRFYAQVGGATSRNASASLESRVEAPRVEAPGGSTLMPSALEVPAHVFKPPLQPAHTPPVGRGPVPSAASEAPQPRRRRLIESDSSQS